MESVDDFPHRLCNLCDMISCIRRKHNTTQLEDDVLLNKFVGQLKEELIKKKLREQILTNPTLPFLEAGNFALRSTETEMISTKHFKNCQISVRETISIQNSDRTEESSNLRLIQDSIKKLSSDAEKFSEWVICLHKDIIDLKEKMREIRQYQQTNTSQSRRFCANEKVFSQGRFQIDRQNSMATRKQQNREITCI